MAEGDFSFTCHVALQMVTLLGASGSPLPELTPLTWGWGGREGGWRRMAPVGAGGGGRGRRKEGRADEPAGWWVSLRGFPVLALPPAAAAAATTATAAAAAGAGDSTFKMAPAGLGSDVIGGGTAGRGRGRGEAGSGRAASWPRPFLFAGPPGPTVLRRARARALRIGDRGSGIGDRGPGLFRRPVRAPLGPAPPVPSPRAVPDPGAAQLSRKSPRSQGFVRACVFLANARFAP